MSAKAHGTVSRYKAGCHCGPCTKANRNYVRRTRSTPNIGPSWVGQANYPLHVEYVPDTLTRAEFLELRGY